MTYPLELVETSGVAPVVERLAELRRKAQQRRYAGAAPQLPSRQGIRAMAEEFLSVLYPRQFGESASNKIDAFVGSALGRARIVLEREIRLERQLAEHGVGTVSASSDDPARVAEAFVETLPDIRERVDADIRAALDADPSQGSFDEMVFSSSGLAAILRHRLAHELYRLGVPLMAKIVAEDARSKTGVDIHPGAEIGEGFSLANGAGLSIGETAVVGRNVRMHQAVTLGENVSIDVGDGAAPAALTSGARRHPRIEDEVVIHAGASLYGPIVVGRGSLIGRNVWLTHDVPAGVKIS